MPSNIYGLGKISKEEAVAILKVFTGKGKKLGDDNEAENVFYNINHPSKFAQETILRAHKIDVSTDEIKKELNEILAVKVREFGYVGHIRARLLPFSDYDKKEEYKEEFNKIKLEIKRLQNYLYKKINGNGNIVMVDDTLGTLFVKLKATKKQADKVKKQDIFNNYFKSGNTDITAIPDAELLKAHKGQEKHFKNMLNDIKKIDPDYDLSILKEYFVKDPEDALKNIHAVHNDMITILKNELEEYIKKSKISTKAEINEMWKAFKKDPKEALSSIINIYNNENQPPEPTPEANANSKAVNLNEDEAYKEEIKPKFTSQPVTPSDVNIKMESSSGSGITNALMNAAKAVISSTTAGFNDFMAQRKANHKDPNENIKPSDPKANETVDPKNTENLNSDSIYMDDNKKIIVKNDTHRVGLAKSTGIIHQPRFNKMMDRLNPSKNFKKVLAHKVTGVLPNYDVAKYNKHF